jgi:hypothetical protein
MNRAAITVKAAAAAVVGAALAVATDHGLRSHSERKRARYAALGLVGAALVYPAAQASPSGKGERRHEWASVAAAAALVAASFRAPDPAARYTLALGWTAHAGFDMRHKAGPESRLPRWYPALCAGYDVAVARALLRRVGA